MSARTTWFPAISESPFGLPAETTSPAEEVTRLFGELHAPLVRYLVSMGLSPADGEEVAQEAFVALFDHLRRGRPRTNLRAWVFRVAHRQGLKRRRRESRRCAWTPEADLAEVARCGAPNPEERLAARQRRRRMESVVRALPERDQACLHLRAEGLSYREISRTLRMSLGAVSLSIRRSVERLHRAEGAS